MRQRARNFALFILLSASVTAAHATCGGGGGGGVGGMTPPEGGGAQPQQQVYYVPWKLFDAAAPATTSSLRLYWFPASPDDARRSELRVSRQLTLNAAQCVDMLIVPAEETTLTAKYELAGKLPIALLVDSAGNVVTRVENSRGALRIGAVEKMLRDELSSREKSLAAQLNEAKAKATADKAAATALYESVWKQRCLFPSLGRKAQKALNGLGVAAVDSELRLVDPDLSPATTKKITALMAKGLRAELHDRYLEALELYLAASRVDPADAVPLRYLGEVYRHHTGQWDLAVATFNQLLTLQPDPISRAVALHGLGKISIHEGAYAKGLALFEQSIAAYPLALTYRNLAVYWNSENDHDKAYGYVKQAIALEPHDPYNVIFAATYLADAGKTDEALRIALENEGILAASYNLAAIHAVLGDKTKALQLLRRHFYTYERFAAVREKEMMEARVDYVFSSIRHDPEFEKLTSGR